MESKIIAILCGIVTAFLVCALFYCKRKGAEKELYLCWILPVIFWAVSTVVWIVRAIHGV